MTAFTAFTAGTTEEESVFPSPPNSMADTREKALQDYRKKLLEHKEVDGRLKECREASHFIGGVIHIKIWFTSCELVSSASGSAT